MVRSWPTSNSGRTFSQQNRIGNAFLQKLLLGIVDMVNTMFSRLRAI